MQAGARHLAMLHDSLLYAYAGVLLLKQLFVLDIAGALNEGPPSNATV